MSPEFIGLSIGKKIDISNSGDTLYEFQPTDSKGLPALSGRLLTERLSFSHFIKIMKLEPVLKRPFMK